MLFYRGMTCENVTIKGDRGTPITAYVAKPSGPGAHFGDGERRFHSMVSACSFDGEQAFHAILSGRFDRHG
jgi:carboxymethylenebutenolidase